MATAILVDGAFFLRRFKFSFPDHDPQDPAQVAHGLGLMSYWHLALRIGPEKLSDEIANHNFQLSESPTFYRLFFYDCQPLTKRMHYPISKRSINFAKTEEAIFRLAVHHEIKKLRKVAIRLGRLNDTSLWRLKADSTDRLIEDKQTFDPTDQDFEVDTKQKGVDMRLGLDVASLAFKRQVDQIILVAADADFVPAAKLARREGIDVILDKMRDSRAAKDLIDHVDGVRDCYLPAPEGHKP
ncbi:MAG: NYN domain-containing protein [Pseudomonadota bacterium]